jgi:dTDP-4-dehydrorhamnose 3,5-epimerase
LIFTPTSVEGVVVVDLEPRRDERGSFARTFCVDEFADHGLELSVKQASVSVNPTLGILRGMHYQADPRPEPKLVRCTRGRIFDVAVDLRPSSPTYCGWVGVDLDAETGNALFIPPGCAHGFLTTAAPAEVSYFIGARYAPELARGVRWDDSAFGIAWPSPPAVMSERDATYPDFLP